MEWQKVKYNADCNKNWAKLIKYVGCTSSISEPPKILPVREIKIIYEKSDSKECKTNLVKQIAVKNWAKLTKYASCTSSW